MIYVGNMRSLPVILLAAVLGCAAVSAGPDGSGAARSVCAPEGAEADNGWAVGALTGLVRGADDGKPVEGAQVRLLGTGCAAITGLDGRYRLADVPVGTYTVVVRVIGYETNSVADVAVLEDGVTEVDLVLEPWSE